MRKQLKNIISLLLVATILFASTGVVIASHVCSASKKSDVSLFQTKGCCSKEGKECGSIPTSSAQLKKNCCSLSLTYNKLDVNSLQKIFSTEDFISHPAEHVIFQHHISLFDFNPKSETQDPKFLKGGSDFLHTVHQLLI